MRRRQLAAALATSAALLAATACTSSIAGTATTAGAAATAAANGSATGKPEPLSPDQVASAVKTAYQGASAVHIKGSTTDSGSAITIDLQLNKDSGSGTLGVSGMAVTVSWVNSVYYVQCTDLVITKMGLSPTSGPGAALRNKWLSSESRIGAGMVNGFKDKLSYNAFLQDMVGKIDEAKFAAAGSETVNGAAVLAFKDLDGSTTYVAASSPNYLMRVVGPPSNPGSLDFTGWNHPVAVTAPPASEIYSGPSA